MTPTVQAFFDPATNTISYVVKEPHGRHCAVIDSVLDFDPKSGQMETASADRIVAYVSENDLVVDWILETHVHADHLSAAPYLKKTLGGQTGIGQHIVQVQQAFRKVFNTGPSFAADGTQFDQLFEDNETIPIGAMPMRVMDTPGHTPACITYLAGDAAFVGDTIFAPDYGTARTDFPGGDAAALFQSIRKILSLESQTRLFLCHDYPPESRRARWQTTVAEQRADNIHIHDGVGEEEFVTMRTERDKTLSMPQLLFPSIQVNMRAGDLPPPEDNGISYLKIPVGYRL